MNTLFLKGYSVDIKMILSDLDGTLLGHDRQISSYTEQVLTRAAERGVVIVPATGRFYGAMPASLRRLPFIRYAILMNGAQVYDCAEQKVLYRAELPVEVAGRIFARLSALPATIDCFVDDNCGYMDAYYHSRVEEWVSDLNARQIILETRQPVENLPQYILALGKPVQKIQSFFKDIALRDRMMLELSEEFPDIAVACSLPGNLEITHRRATKGEALRFLCDYLKIDPAQVMAFGDERNDCAMLELAGIGAAMENAVPQAKAVADIVVGAYWEDAVAHMIEEAVLQQA